MWRTKDPHDDFAGFAATVDGARLLDFWLDREATATSPLVDLGAQMRRVQRRLARRP